mgnify:CR=1 FL=1
MPKRKRAKSKTVSSPLMSLQEVADYIQVSNRTILVWAHKGDIPGFKLGNIWRFKKTDIDAWIEACRDQTPRKAEDD